LIIIVEKLTIFEEDERVRLVERKLNGSEPNQSSVSSLVILIHLPIKAAAAQRGKLYQAL
jgi:hypothetical protein